MDHFALINLSYKNHLYFKYNQLCKISPPKIFHLTSFSQLHYSRSFRLLHYVHYLVSCFIHTRLSQRLLELLQQNSSSPWLSQTQYSLAVKLTATLHCDWLSCLSARGNQMFETEQYFSFPSKLKPYLTSLSNDFEFRHRFVYYHIEKVTLAVKCLSERN